MRVSARFLAAWLILLLLAASCAAEGFSFAVPEPDRPAPASLDGLSCAANLLAVPRFRTESDGTALLLTAAEPLPEGVQVTVITADGAPCEAEVCSPAALRMASPPERCWLRLRWNGDGTLYEARYLIQAGDPCAFWEATADDGDRRLTLNALTGAFTLSMTLDNVARTELRYDGDGRFAGAVLMGDTREKGTLPMIVQYDEYGRASAVTAADLLTGYTFNRAQGAWYDSQGRAVELETLPPFDLRRHPAPAAREIAYGDLHLREENAGIDREALLAAAPVLGEITAGEGLAAFTADADEALLTVDGAWVFDSRLGSLHRDGTAFTAADPDLTEESVLTVTLIRGSLTAVYEKGALVSVTNRAAGLRWTADGRITLTNGAATVTYSPRGALSGVVVESADGARLTYDARGTLTGLELDGYIWTRKAAWKSTAVNEKGTVIHPSASQPKRINLKDYPALTFAD